MTKIFQSGNQAIVQAALKSGLKFFAAYPITPASDIMHQLASAKIEFLHAEDEIASVNMVVGAALAGAKAMTATSGPGFSLMQEGIGYAHKINAPCVIVDVQRVGPSTGMPTLPSQGDVMQARYGSHGDYYPIVFYPNSMRECYKYTIEAFNAAEESRSPVILLSDAFVGHLYETDVLDKVSVKKRTLKPLGTSLRHFTGLLDKKGVPRAKDSQYYREWITEVKKKKEKVAKNYAFYEYLDNKKADTLLIAYGFVSRVVLSLKEEYAIFRPIRMFPVLEDELKKISKRYKKIIVIEMNAGMYRNEVQRVLKRDVQLISITGGSIFLEDIKKALK